MGAFVRSLGIPLDLRSICSANWTCAVGLEPLVDTLGVEFVTAGQHSEQLARLEITHAHHTHGLLRLVVVGVEPVGRQLLYVRFGQAAGLGFSQALR